MKIQITDNQKNTLLLFARFAAGVLFFFSGFSKLTRPNEYFQIAIAQYELFPFDFIPLIAHVVPWVEIILSAHLLLGLYIPLAATGLAILAGLFQLILAQALLRKLPIDECGCFGGGSFHLTLYQSFALDSLFTIIFILIASADRFPLSLDSLFQQKSHPNN